MFSRTVISRNRLWFCGTCTTPRSSICRGFFPTSGTPRNVMLPRRGLSSPLIVASSVDLPEPFGPTMQVRPPSATANDTPCSTSPPPYPATTPSTTSAGSDPGTAGLDVAVTVAVLVVGTEVRIEHLAVVAHLPGRAGCDHRAIVHDHDRITQAHNEIHVVLDDQVDQRRVHPARRLVEQHDLRIGDQHVGELKQLALAVRQRLRERRGVRGEPDEVEQFHRMSPRGSTAGPGQRIAGPLFVLPGDQHVLEYRHAREDPGELECPSDAQAEYRFRRGIGDRLPGQEYLAGIGPRVPGDDVEQRRLA